MNCCPIKSNTIQNICEQYDPTNLKKEPTCHKGPTPSLLDDILVSNARRYSAILNVCCDISDFHNIIGAATKCFAPSQKPRIIRYRSYKNFSESEFVNSVASAPFHVMDIFDEISDMAWYTSALLRTIIDEHAPWKLELLNVTPCHTWIQPCGKPNINEIWLETNSKDLESITGKKTTAQEIMLSKLENNQCKNISKTAVRKMGHNKSVLFRQTVPKRT